MTDAQTIPPRVTATPAALRLIAEIREDHPDIIFHQSGGCCDGSSPMCYPAGEFRLGDVDICLGAVDGVPVYISSSQFDAWRHTQLILDVVPGRGGMFSLDNGREQRFLSRARTFSPEERQSGQIGNEAAPTSSARVVRLSPPFSPDFCIDPAGRLLHE